MKKQIVAISGGGFSSEPDNLALDHYLLSQTAKTSPTVCFLASATGDSDFYIRKFYQSFRRLDCVPHHLGLFDIQSNKLEETLLSYDAVYVGGGNLRSMLALWKGWDLDAALKKAYEKGIVLGGISAGSLCWFEEAFADPMPSTYCTLRGLGLVRGSNCVHFDKDPEQGTLYKRYVADQKISPGYAVDNHAALHFVDGELHAVVASDDKSKAFRVDPRGSEASVTPLPVTLLPRVA